jgi:micrococcal nuclease
MHKKTQIIILIVLILLLIGINYPFLDSSLENFLMDYETGIVKRVIDGDTIIVNNESVRLLGINTPEKGEKYYGEAKEFLEELILDKKVRLEGNEKDKYYRKLRYIFLGNQNINLRLIKEGFANVYILGHEEHEEELRNVWNKCLVKNKNLCEKSKDKCTNCIELKKFDYRNQEVIFYNDCGFDCDLNDWIIKDEGRKKFVFQDFVLEKNKEVKITAKDFGEDYVWTKTGDTLFLRDKEGRLVLWESY